MAGSRDSIMTTIDTYIATYSATDREGWLECFADDAWIEHPVGSERRQGLDAIGEFWDESHAIPDSIELRLGDLRIIIGQEAAFTLEARPNLGGETYRFDVIDHMSFDAEGKITSSRSFYDAATMRPARD
ncbi:MAG TPA: nuclear transport factor 2 family protein [Acidimicrobiales bacterium]|nr:nuclear transport factor 2 family protein [Acidimicrobiales bacterium]